MTGVVEVRDEAWTFSHLPDALETLGVEPRGVLHVGGHHGEEVPVYQRCGFASITLVEPLPSNCTAIRDRYPDVDLVQAACVPAGDGMVSFFTDGRSCGGGLAGGIPSPEVNRVPVAAIRDLQTRGVYNVLVVDTQGTELDVLRAADLSPLDLVIVETRDDGPGLDAPYLPDVVEYMDGQGWRPAVSWLRGQHWADVLFVRGSDA